MVTQLPEAQGSGHGHITQWSQKVTWPVSGHMTQVSMETRAAASRCAVKRKWTMTRSGDTPRKLVLYFAPTGTWLPQGVKTLHVPLSRPDQTRPKLWRRNPGHLCSLRVTLYPLSPALVGKRRLRSDQCRLSPCLCFENSSGWRR